jgi:hypothetical protein
MPLLFHLSSCVREKFISSNTGSKNTNGFTMINSKKSVVCFTCATAAAHNLLDSVNFIEPAFISTGYRNWKKASGNNGRFQLHQVSLCHRVATNALADLKHNTPITTQLSKQLSSEQVVARKCLKILFTTVGFLARQGLALRGHDEDEGNFMQLLHTRCRNVPELSGWLSRRKDFIHHAIQDEILKLYSNAISRQILDDIRVSQNFSVIIDGTQDIMRVEQESLCIRFVDNNLIPHESFVGFYAVDGTTGQILANCIRDSLCRFNLSLEKLRGKTYDGASNMNGIYSGCQAIIKQLQPLAIYVHCCSHCTHLVGNAACSASTIVANSIQLVNEFGVL